MDSLRRGRTDPSTRFFYGWVVVGVAFSTEFVAGCVLYPFAVSLTQLADEFGGSSALLARAFGRDQCGPMFGLMWVIAMPPSLVGPLLAAWIHDQRGSYDAAFGLFVLALLGTALLVRSVRFPVPE